MAPEQSHACAAFVRSSRLLPLPNKKMVMYDFCRALELHAVFAFFYCVVVPRGNEQEIYSGRVNCLNAYEASQAVEMLHPDALEIRVRKHKTLNAV